MQSEDLGELIRGKKILDFGLFLKTIYGYSWLFLFRVPCIRFIERAVSQLVEKSDKNRLEKLG